jgi:hypothetical protein
MIRLLGFSDRRWLSLQMKRDSYETDKNDLMVRFSKE